SLRTRRWVPLAGSKEDGDERLVLEPVDNRPDAERQAISHQMLEAIERAIEALSAQQKTIFRLRHYEDLSLEDIASHLGLRAGTVRAHLFRAIHKIRKELAGWRRPFEGESF
ncbi:MAG TPA: sigma-70 family RNA polymerase sigma factor, partial [Thermoanaerobaculia bacterium]